MTPLLWAAWRCEVGAAAAAVAVWALTRAAGRHLPPRWRCHLWLLVLARLCLPVLPSIPVHLPHWAGSLAGTRPVTSLTGPTAAGGVPARVGPAIDGPSGRRTTASAPAAIQPPPSPRFDPVPWLVRAWAAVAAVLLARLAVQTVRTARLTRSYPPLADADLLAELSAAAAHLGRRRPPLAVVTPPGTGPAVTGLFRPRLLLPADFADRLPAAARRLVLLHELAHVRRRDVLLGTLASAVAAVHWFNPAAWLALSQLRTERELAADAAVLDATGDRAAYGDTLVNLVRAHLTPSPVSASAMAEPVHALHRRITMIARHRSATARQGVAAVLVGLAVATTAVAWAAAPLATRPADAGGGPAPELIVSVDGRMLTLRPLTDLSAKPVTAAVDGATDVRIDGQPAKPSALRPGMIVDAIPLPGGAATISAQTAAAGLVVRVEGHTIFLQRLPPDRTELPPDGARPTGPADMAFTTDAATGVTVMGRGHSGHGWTQLRRGTMADAGLAASVGPGAFLTVMLDGGSGRAGDLDVLPYLPPDEVTVVSPPVQGTFERLDPDRLIVRTFARHDGVCRAGVSVGADTVVTIDNAPARLTDLQAGLQLDVRSLPTGRGRPAHLQVSASTAALSGVLAKVDGNRLTLNAGFDGHAVTLTTDGRTQVIFVHVIGSGDPTWRSGRRTLADLRPGMLLQVRPLVGSPAKSILVSPDFRLRRRLTTAPAPRAVAAGRVRGRVVSTGGPTLTIQPLPAGDPLRVTVDERVTLFVDGENDVPSAVRPGMSVDVGTLTPSGTVLHVRSVPPSTRP